jgi:GNAT superfamily N-acetyltransferase
MTHVKFRRATLEDWSSLYPLLEQMGSTQSEEKSRARFKEILEDKLHFIVVAESKNLVGYAWTQSYGAHLRSGDVTARLNDLFVTPAQRNQGIAKGLLESVIVWAQTLNVGYLQWQANKKSAAFYERLGHVAILDPDPEHPFFEIEFKTNLNV